MEKLNCLQLSFVIFGGFMCYFLADGYTYSVGVFYPFFLEAFNSSDTSTALLPGLLYSVPQLASPFLCPTLSVYGYSSGAAWAAIILCLSCIGSSLAPNIGLLYLTFGVITSIGLQTTYSSAIMAVTAAFKDSRFFGPAVGLTMCGSGVGAFVTTPMLNYIMAIWTWRGALVIEAAILLNVLVASACFHHVDAIEFRHQVIRHSSAKAVKGGRSELQLSPTEAPLQTVHSHSDLAKVNENGDIEGLRSDGKRSGLAWSDLRYLLFVPSRLRFQSVTALPATAVNERELLEPDCQQQQLTGFGEFLGLFVASMKQLVSPGIWCNPRLLCYILANGITGLGIVIPYTYLPHYVQLAFHSVVGDSVQADSGWLVSLIGLGALVGQVLFGLATFQFGDPRQLCCPKRSPQGQNDKVGPNTSAIRSETSPGSSSSGATTTAASRLSCPSRLIFLFMGTLLWNSLFTLAIAWMPLGTEDGQQLANDSSIFELPVGRALAAISFLLGISNGGVYVLYPQILVQVAGDQLWPAALSIFLAFNGVTNMTGTLVSAELFSLTGSYQIAFLLGGLFPLIGFLLIVGQHLLTSLWTCRGRRQSSAVDTRRGWTAEEQRGVV